ncbi:MAG: hypothetical protein J6A63_10315 [Clostridia bacterium]|nr:hypothetical protein [Clostridia bacterium]
MNKPFVVPELKVIEYQDDILTASGEGTAKDATWVSEDVLKNLWGDNS